MARASRGWRMIIGRAADIDWRTSFAATAPRTPYAR
jgi:hypothetical protein